MVNKTDKITKNLLSAMARCMRGSKGAKEHDGNNFDKNQKNKIAQCLAECIPGFKDPNENDESNEKNNFNENYKNLLSVIAFTKHKHNVIHEARA